MNILVVLSHDEFVKIIGMKHLREGWIVYAAHVSEFPPPLRIGKAIPNLYMVRRGEIRIIEVEVDTKTGLKRCISQLKDFIPRADDVYLGMCSEVQEAKEILKENGLESLKVFSPDTMEEI